VVCDEKKPQKKKRTPITPTRQQKLRISGHVKGTVSKTQNAVKKEQTKRTKCQCHANQANAQCDVMFWWNFAIYKPGGAMWK
jgi:hypothetical protein